MAVARYGYQNRTNSVRPGLWSPAEGAWSVGMFQNAQADSTHKGFIPQKSGKHMQFDADFVVQVSKSRDRFYLKAGIVFGHQVWH